MKRIISLTILTISMTIGFNNANAQVGMMTNNPDKSSILDLSNTNKGLLLPRIDLMSLTDKISINGGDPATSLLVFNTNPSLTGGTGFYYWDGSIWKKFISQGDSVAGDNLGNHTATMNINLNGNSINSSATTDNTKGLKFDTSGNGTFQQNTIVTNNTTTNTAQIKKGTDGYSPQPGYVAKSADYQGNVIWAPINDEGVVAPKLMAVAKNSTVNTTFTSGQIWFNTLTYDPEYAVNLGSSSSNGFKYTVKKAGLHQVFLNFSNNATSSPFTFYLRVLKNGTPIAAIDATAAIGSSACVFAIDQFNPGDVITVDKGGNNTGWMANLAKVTIFRFE